MWMKGREEEGPPRLSQANLNVALLFTNFLPQGHTYTKNNSVLYHFYQLSENLCMPQHWFKPMSACVSHYQTSLISPLIWVTLGALWAQDGRISVNFIWNWLNGDWWEIKALRCQRWLNHKGRSSLLSTAYSYCTAALHCTALCCFVLGRCLVRYNRYITKGEPSKDLWNFSTLIDSALCSFSFIALFDITILGIPLCRKVVSTEHHFILCFIDLQSHVHIQLYVQVLSQKTAIV